MATAPRQKTFNFWTSTDAGKYITIKMKDGSKWHLATLTDSTCDKGVIKGVIIQAPPLVRLARPPARATVQAVIAKGDPLRVNGTVVGVVNMAYYASGMPCWHD